MSRRLIAASFALMTALTTGLAGCSGGDATPNAPANGIEVEVTDPPPNLPDDAPGPETYGPDEGLNADEPTEGRP